MARSVDGLLDACLGLLPVEAAEAAEGRLLGAGVARDAGDLLDGDVDPVRAVERELQVVALLARRAAPQHPFVAGDAVVDVDDEVARRQPLQDVARDDASKRARPTDADGAEELAVRDEDEAVGPAGEAAVEAALDRGRRRRAAAPRGDD